jgi:peptidoglycan hydrolase-like protein with peptidoglycan-binding domain
VPTIHRRCWLRASLAVLGAALSFAVVAGEATARESKGAKVVHAAGSTVKALQRALGIPADGIYGPQTKRAVRRFQRSHGLVVDGLAGSQTLQALGVRARTARRDGSATTVLAQIAQCESGGNPRAVSANGRYFGKYQFSRATWRSVGGRGSPARASEAEQDRRARILYRRAGTSPWPHCGV